VEAACNESSRRGPEAWGAYGGSGAATVDTRVSVRFRVASF
jgi:hypothetical protein